MVMNAEETSSFNKLFSAGTRNLGACLGLTDGIVKFGSWAYDIPNL
jgi:hypothetical protein